MKPSNSVQAWKKSSRKIVSPTPINEIQTLEQERWILSDSELNLVLGGGVVAGSIILLGGEPGIGKSTLLLQMALQTQANVLYVSGEESETQIKMRASGCKAGSSNDLVLGWFRVSLPGPRIISSSATQCAAG